jgi:hypothetical protein
LLDRNISNNEIVLPSVVLTEVMCEPALPATHAAQIRTLPILEISDGYWLRAAETRAKLLSRKLRARLADTLIAQSCIDHDVALITRDSDFRHFAKHCGLKLA